MLYLIVSSLSWLSIPVLFWIFRHEEDYRPSLGKKRSLYILTTVYLAFALFPLLKGDGGGMSLAFTVLPLLYICVFRRHIRVLFTYFRKNVILLAVPIFLLLILEEGFLALGYRISGFEPYTSLYQVGKHLLSYTGFYIGITATIIFFHNRYQFSRWQLFMAGGLWGILVEQEFKGLKMLYAGEFSNLFFYVPIIFLTYGLYLLWPKVVFSEELKGKIHSTRWHVLLLWVVVSIVPIATWLAWSFLLKMAGIDTGGII